MHPRVVAERTQLATERIRAASTLLAEKSKLDPPELITRRGNIDAPTQTLLFQESLAEFLENLADPGAVKRRITAERKAAAEPFTVVDPEPEPEPEAPTETSETEETAVVLDIDGTHQLPPPMVDGEGAPGEVPGEAENQAPGEVPGEAENQATGEPPADQDGGTQTTNEPS